ncbi:class I SAM-dependent methyltransferase [Mesobacterium pallidum]|uniref:class I SAM-dependent methyltransferase n=1 Tax=Mesobacterium pallidum TaxID=2872037 RepID=UPI001EE1DC59|nr:methyltransferase [Mesobacterium pallidum]
MSLSDRLPLALSGGLVLPEGRIAVLGARAGDDLSDLPQDALVIESTNAPDHAALTAAGRETVVSATGAFAAAIVVLPRAKALARARLAHAATLAPLVIVDGQKTDGVDSLLKDLRQRGTVDGVLSKAHGKIFWGAPGDLSDWAAPEAQKVEGGWITAPGVFSADGIDPGSAMLAEALPQKLGAHVADLGSGWGYLAHHVLARQGVARVDLVEADHAAHLCAQANLADAGDRARFHWADATTWGTPRSVDAVVMNPPFHTGRAAEPALGQAFIRNAARILRPSGTLWLVANRHLPYEMDLRDHFALVDEVAGDTRYKVVQARKPRTQRRG